MNFSGDGSEAATSIFLDGVGKLVSERRQEIPALWASACKVRLHNTSSCYVLTFERKQGPVRFETSNPVVLLSVNIEKKPRVTRSQVTAHLAMNLEAPQPSLYQSDRQGILQSPNLAKKVSSHSMLLTHPVHGAKREQNLFHKEYPHMKHHHARLNWFKFRTTTTRAV
jgi:hypothetical protein